MTFSNVRREIAGISISELANQFGTPLYVYDAATILARVEELRQFDAIRFAQKACSNISILKLLREAGVVVDAVSAGEIHRALKAGFTTTGEPAPVQYCADIFDRQALQMVVDLNIPVNCGSPDMIDQLGEVAPGRNITLRINPGFGHGHSQKTNTGGEQSKHGIWHEDLDDCMQRAERHGLKITGLHMHIGSGTDFEHLAQVCKAMENTALKVGSSIQTISAGGGLPTPYRTTDRRIDIDCYFKLWDEVRQRLQETFQHPVSLEIEPGRYLSAEAGFLISEIRAIKTMGSNTFYLLDAGFNNLARPILYGAYHPMSIMPRDGNENRPLQEVIVGGPLCESGDIFTQEEGGFVCRRQLPAAQIGDYLIIECAGAYGSVMGSNYNSKPLAGEVLIRDGKASLIRRTQTLDEILAQEVLI